MALTQVGLLKITTDSDQMVIVQTSPPNGVRLGEGEYCHAALPSTDTTPLG